eukprot:g16976.t1
MWLCVRICTLHAFNNFLEGPDDEGEAELTRQLNDEEDEEAEPIEDGPDPILELQEKMAQFLDQNEKLKGKNAALQRALINRRAQDKSYDASEKQSEGKVTEHKYQNMLNNVHSERMKLRLQQVMAARMSDELKNQLEAKRQKAIECRDSFQEFKRQIARHAEYARTGKKIQEKIIQDLCLLPGTRSYYVTGSSSREIKNNWGGEAQLGLLEEVEEFELDKDAEVEEVRGSNISLKNRLAKLEQALRNKDELAENLHVIDFEQLKIENQQLNEKIEERNEELHKLRKKTIVTVQIITHMREKALQQLDQDLGAQRDLVTKTKHERDEHRQEYASLKQQTGIMNSEHLTKDFKDAGRFKCIWDGYYRPRMFMVNWDEVWWLCDVLDVHGDRCTVKYHDGGDVEESVEVACRVRRPKDRVVYEDTLVEAYCDGLWRPGHVRQVDRQLKTCVVDFKDDCDENEVVPFCQIRPVIEVSGGRSKVRFLDGEEREVTQELITQLKKRHSQMSQFIKSHGGVI